MSRTLTFEGLRPSSSPRARLSRRLETLAAVAFGLAFSLVAGDVRADDNDLAIDLGPAPMLFRRVARGKFVEGSPASEVGREPDEAERAVTITHDYWVGKFPVTRGIFARFVTETRYVTEAEKGQSGGFGWDGTKLVQKKEFSWRNPGFPQTDDHPVVLVTFADANAFSAWASKKSGKKVRLPTEAEWEYAARAGTTTPWSNGASVDDALAMGWFKGNAGAGTHPVGQRKANAFGLFDMGGNVFEWCRDIYVPTYGPPAVDPEVVLSTSSEPERRVLRGGSFLKDPKRGRSAARHKNTPGSRNADNGFRVIVVGDDVIGPTTQGTTDFGQVAPLGLGQGGPGASPTTGTTGSAPVTVAEPPASAPPSSGLGWLLVVAPPSAAAVVVAWMLARRKRAAPVPNASGVSTRATEDGFWIEAPGQPAGTRARYEAMVGGVLVSDVVPLDGGGRTFVYTGQPPSSIRVTELTVVEAANYRAAEPVPPPLVVPPVPLRRPPPPVPPARPRSPSQVERESDPEPISDERLFAALNMAASSGNEPVASAVPTPPPTEPDPAPEPFLGHPRAY